jgi:hypothetical protein
MKVKAYKVAAQLEKLDFGEDIEQFGPRVLDIMRGVPWNVWTELDEKPGRFGYMRDRFYMLRQVRNHPVWGRKLFAGLTGK